MEIVNCKQKIVNYVYILYIHILILEAHKKSALAGNFVNCFIKTQFNAFCDQIVN